MSLPAKSRCPVCGNTDQARMESNGENALSPHLTIVCLVRLPVAELEYNPATEDIDAQGLAACGTQWDPNTDPDPIAEES